MTARRRSGPKRRTPARVSGETTERAGARTAEDVTAGPPADASDGASADAGDGTAVAVGGASAGRAKGAAGPANGGAGGRAEERVHDPRATAQAVCLRLLTIAPRTRAQLATALRQRGVPETVAEEVLSRFAETGLIDDVAFATAWVESRHYSRGLSRRALAAELHQRGVGDAEIRDAISELDPQQEDATARRLVEAKLAATRGQSPQARTRRLAGMLARKGYPAGTVFRVVREALEREGIDAGSTTRRKRPLRRRTRGRTARVRADAPARAESR